MTAVSQMLLLHLAAGRSEQGKEWREAKDRPLGFLLVLSSYCLNGVSLLVLGAETIQWGPSLSLSLCMI